MKKPLQAIAIEYGSNPVPLVVAKGEGDLAQKVIDAAIAAGVPIKKDEELVALLGLLDINEKNTAVTLYLGSRGIGLYL